MIRKVIEIDEQRCNGCGICADACHEGAIGIVDGKARLLRDDFCDGMGDCLPSCPADAISFVEREALPYDAEAVASAASKAQGHVAAAKGPAQDLPSALGNWPVQIKLAPPSAPYFHGADLLVAADCCAYAHAGFHHDFMEGKVTLVGCPKLDGVDYADKLAQIVAANAVSSITITRMEVPCCGGLENAVARAAQAGVSKVPVEVVTFSIEGEIIDRKTL